MTAEWAGVTCVRSRLPSEFLMVDLSSFSSVQRPSFILCSYQCPYLVGYLMIVQHIIGVSGSDLDLC